MLYSSINTSNITKDNLRVWMDEGFPPKYTHLFDKQFFNLMTLNYLCYPMAPIKRYVSIDSKCSFCRKDCGYETDIFFYHPAYEGFFAYYKYIVCDSSLKRIGDYKDQYMLMIDVLNNHVVKDVRNYIKRLFVTIKSFAPCIPQIRKL